MFCDDEGEELPWDYFLTNYERDLLTLTHEEVVCKNPDKTPEEITTDIEQIKVSQVTLQMRKTGKLA